MRSVKLEEPTKMLSPRPSGYKPWTEDEKRRLSESVAARGFGIDSVVRGGWRAVADDVGSRNPRQCRERYLNYIDSSVDRRPLKPHEKQLIREKQAELGNSWATIAKLLPGRSADIVKNYFNSYLVSEGRRQRRRCPRSLEGSFERATRLLGDLDPLGPPPAPPAAFFPTEEPTDSLDLFGLLDDLDAELPQSTALKCKAPKKRKRPPTPQTPRRGASPEKAPQKSPERAMSPAKLPSTTRLPAPRRAKRAVCVVRSLALCAPGSAAALRQLTAAFRRPPPLQLQQASDPSYEAIEALVL